MALAVFVFWNTAIVLDSQNDETIDAEVTGLTEQYTNYGLPALTDAIIGRSIKGGQGLYLLANGDRRYIAGNLDNWPMVKPASNGFVEFDYERKIADQSED